MQQFTRNTGRPANAQWGLPDAWTHAALRVGAERRTISSRPQSPVRRF